MIGHLTDEGKAKAFGDVLYGRGIESMVEADGPGTFAVWVHDEEQLDQATELLAAFQADPARQDFRDASREAARRRQKVEQEQSAYEKRFRDFHNVFPPLGSRRPGAVTWFLLVASVVVTLVTEFGQNRQLTHYLLISTTRDGLISDLAQGEIWRLVTPIFLHMSFLHILFNVMWLWDLGAMVESRQGSRFFAVQVLIIAVGSNVAQYLMSGPGFGGMSGVVYGLLGYIWVRGRFDPRCGLALHPSTVMMMMIWLLLCFTGVMGRVANTVHLVGLIVGVVWGYLHAQVRR